MIHPFDEFCDAVRTLSPRTAIVLGSGLTGVTEEFVESATVHYGNIPGLVPPTIAGHKGQLSVGVWNNVSVLVCFGRVHFYEGYMQREVIFPMRVMARMGIRSVVITNAAGGINLAYKQGCRARQRREHAAASGDSTS